MYLIILLIPLLASYPLYFIACYVNPEHLSYIDYLVASYMMLLSGVGSYQYFFDIQQKNYYFKTRCLESKWDSYIPFIPSFVWVYSVLYYAFLGMMLLQMTSLKEVCLLIFSGFVLLAIHSIFFLLFPVVTPSHYRQYNEDSISKRFLQLIQMYDNGRCCFPSLHCSTIVFASYVLYPIFGAYVLLMVLLITLSCVFTKQHQIVDFILSWPLTWFVYHYVFLSLLQR